MKRVVQVKLLPTNEQAQWLAHTLELANTAANVVSIRARKMLGTKTSKLRPKDLQEVTYNTCRGYFDLSAQMSVRVAAKVAGSYNTLSSNLKNGNYGKIGSKRRKKIEKRVIEFRKFSAQPYDDRILSWKYDTNEVSIWVHDKTQGKRIKIPYTGRLHDLELLSKYRQGESDLVFRNGKWFLIATLDIPEPITQTPKGFLGVDMGIVVIAAVNDETGKDIMDFSGGAITKCRKRNRRIRQGLQSKGTKSAKRKLKKRSQKESRFSTNTNHVISKKIVAEAKRTERGIAVEELTGIRERVRLRKPQRADFHSWAFAELGQFLQYKAQQSGVAFVMVDPAYTSQTCSKCNHIDKKARIDQANYVCTNKKCGVSLNADHNAATNIAKRGKSSLAAVKQPNV